VDHQRRHWLQRSAALGLTLAISDWPTALATQPRLLADAPDAPTGARPPAALFTEADAGRIREQLGLSTARPHDGLTLRVTPSTEMALQVPVLMHSRIPGTTALALLVEQNPTPLVAWLATSPGLRAQLQLHIKMAATTWIELYAWANGQVYGCRQQVEVLLSGCD